MKKAFLNQLSQNVINGFKRVPTIISILAGVATIITFMFLLFPNLLSPKVNLSGTWEMTFKIEESEWKPYQNGNLEYKYKITFIQKGADIEGIGEKFWEKINEKEMFYNSKQKTTITIKGKIENNIFSASISEKGYQRETLGFVKFEIMKESIDSINGIFNVTAANSTGIAILKREKINMECE